MSLCSHLPYIVLFVNCSLFSGDAILCSLLPYTIAMCCCLCSDVAILVHCCLCSGVAIHSDLYRYSFIHCCFVHLFVFPLPSALVLLVVKCCHSLLSASKAYRTHALLGAPSAASLLGAALLLDPGYSLLGILQLVRLNEQKLVKVIILINAFLR